MEGVGREGSLGGSQASVPQASNEEDDCLDHMREVGIEESLRGSQVSVAQASDQEAEEYVKQFSPDSQIEDSNQEAHEVDQDDDEEDDSLIIEYLKGFMYDQNY